MSQIVGVIVGVNVGVIVGRGTGGRRALRQKNGKNLWLFALSQRMDHPVFPYRFYEKHSSLLWEACRFYQRPPCEEPLVRAVTDDEEVPLASV